MMRRSLTDAATRRIALPVLALLAVAAAGCNTVKGLGTDIHDIAQNVQVMFEEDRGYVTDARSPSPASPSRPINRQANAH